MIGGLALDPLLVKELTAASRRGRTYLARTLYVGVIGLIVYAFWTTTAARSLNTPSEYAVLGRQLFQSFLPFQILIVSIAAVAASADLIVSEAKGGTLALLLLTPTSPRRILFAKFKAAFTQACLLIACGAPVLAICVFLGGVGFYQLLGSITVTASMAALGSAFGLRASSVHPTAARALLWGLLALIGYTLLPLALLFVGGFIGLIAAPFLHPVYAAGVLLMGSGTHFLEWGWTTSAAFSALIAWLVVKSCATRTRDLVVRPARPQLPLIQERKVLGGRIRVALKLGDRPIRAHREVWENDPLLWKELLTRPGGLPEHRHLVFAGLLFLTLFLWLFSSGRSLGSFRFLGFLFDLIAFAAGVSIFTAEKENRRLEMLLAAPVSSAAIVRSKLLAGLLAPGAQGFALVALVASIAYSWWSALALVLYPLTLLTQLLFVYMVSAAASLKSRTTQGAALGAASILGILFFLVPILSSLLLPPGSREIFGALDPGWALEPLERGGERPLEAIPRFLLFFPIHAGAVIGLGAWMLWRFDRIVGRV